MDTMNSHGRAGGGQLTVQLTSLIDHIDHIYQQQNIQRGKTAAAVLHSELPSNWSRACGWVGDSDPVVDRAMMDFWWRHVLLPLVHRRAGALLCACVWLADWMIVSGSIVELSDSTNIQSHHESFSGSSTLFLTIYWPELNNVKEHYLLMLLLKL